MIDPGSLAETIIPLLGFVGDHPVGITTDGTWIWTANQGGSVSRVAPSFGAPVFTTPGFISPLGILFDGTSIWVTDEGDNKLKKLDSNGGLILGVPVGSDPQFPVFDGFNIWVPNFSSNSVSVIRARDGQVLATITGNGLNGPRQAAFDGQRILVTNYTGIASRCGKQRT
jgi:DNA-binding beta-propeller fold protein YncE